MCGDDADMAHAIENVVDGAFFNSGQCCCGIERVYVHERRYDDFVAGAVDSSRSTASAIRSTRRPPSARWRTGASPISSVARSRRRSPPARGRMSTRKAFPADTGESAYLAPQVLTGVDHAMSVMRDESFGPVVGIMKVEGDEEAIRLMNDSPYGLSAAIWTARRRGGRAHRRPARDRHRLHESLRLSRSRPRLDRASRTPAAAPASRASAIDSVTRPKSFHLRQL